VSAALRDAHGHGLTLKQLAGQLPRDKTLVVYCWNQY